MKKSNITAVLAVMAVFLFSGANQASVDDLVSEGNGGITQRSYTIAIFMMSLSTSLFVLSAVVALPKRS